MCFITLPIATAYNKNKWRGGKKQKQKKCLKFRTFSTKNIRNICNLKNRKNSYMLISLTLFYDNNIKLQVNTNYKLHEMNIYIYIYIVPIYIKHI